MSNISVVGSKDGPVVDEREVDAFLAGRGIGALPARLSVEALSATILDGIETDTASPTGILPTTFGRRSQAGDEVNVDFATYTAGAMPANTNEGQEWHLTSKDDVPANYPIVEARDGTNLMTLPDTTADGAYATIELDDTVQFTGAEWRFIPYAAGADYEYLAGGLPGASYANGVSMALAAWMQPIGENETGLGPASIHLRIEPALWAVGFIPNDTDTSVTDKHVGNFTTSLAVSHTPAFYHVGVAQDSLEGRLYILLPDGTIVKSAQNDAYKQPCRFIFAEPYRNAGAVTGKAKAGFLSFWSARGRYWPHILKAIDKASRPASIKNVAPGDTTQSITNARVRLGGAATDHARLLVQIPSTGKLRFRVHFWLENDADYAGRNRLYLTKDDGTELNNVDFTVTPGHKGPVTIEIDYNIDVTGTVTTDAPGRLSGYRFDVLSTTTNKSRIRFGTITEGRFRCFIEANGY